MRYGELNLARSLGIAVIWLENEYNFGVTACVLLYGESTFGGCRPR
jgi:hypothetical protein